MWPTGTVAHNPVTKEWGRLVEAPDDGSYLKAELLAQPTARVAAPHRHPHQEERFEVAEGQLHYRLGAEEGVMEAGESVTVPPGTMHDWWNAGDRVCHAFVTVTPAGRFSDMIGAVWGLAVLGRADAQGAPRPLDGILLAQAFGTDIVFEKPPPIVQKAMGRVVAPLIRVTGRTVTSREVLDASVVDPASWPASQSGG